MQQQEPVVIETPVEIVEQPVAQQETVATEPVKEEVVANTCSRGNDAGFL